MNTVKAEQTKAQGPDILFMHISRTWIYFTRPIEFSSPSIGCCSLTILRTVRSRSGWTHVVEIPRVEESIPLIELESNPSRRQLLSQTTEPKISTGFNLMPEQTNCMMFSFAVAILGPQFHCHKIYCLGTRF